MSFLGIDVGGTFTDAVLLTDGELRTAKVPTAPRQEESVLAAAAAVGARDVDRESCRLSLLSQRRELAPRGAAGGEDGRPGRNLLNGEALPGSCSRDLQPGDVLTVETPGGGGYGRA